LSLLYPGNDLRNEFHEDHVVPKAILKKKGLVAAGLDPEQVEAVAGVHAVEGGRRGLRLVRRWRWWAIAGRHGREV
jgi:hypothetical protein